MWRLGRVYLRVGVMVGMALAAVCFLGLVGLRGPKIYIGCGA